MIDLFLSSASLTTFSPILLFFFPPLVCDYQNNDSSLPKDIFCCYSVYLNTVIKVIAMKLSGVSLHFPINEEMKVQQQYTCSTVGLWASLTCAVVDLSASCGKR